MHTPYSNTQQHTATHSTAQHHTSPRSIHTATHGIATTHSIHHCSTHVTPDASHQACCVLAACLCVCLSNGNAGFIDGKCQQIGLLTAGDSLQGFLGKSAKYVWVSATQSVLHAGCGMYWPLLQACWCLCIDLCVLLCCVTGYWVVGSWTEQYHDRHLCRPGM